MGRYVFADRRFATYEKQSRHRWNVLTGLTADQPQRTIQLRIVETEQRTVTAIAFYGLSQPMPLGRIEYVDVRARNG